MAGISLAIGLFTVNLLFVRYVDDIVVFTTWRMLLGIPVMAVTTITIRLRPSARIPVVRSRVDWPLRATVGVLGVLFALNAFVNYVAISETTLVNVGVIGALQPAVVTLLAGRYLGEVVDVRLMLGCGVSIVGATLVAAASMGEGTWSLHGDVLAVLGLLSNCAWFLAVRWVRTRRQLDATRFIAIVTNSAVLTLLAVSLLLRRALTFDGRMILFAGLTALTGTVGQTLMAWAHKYVPAAITSASQLTQPALIAVLAWLALGESLQPLHVVGGAVVLVGLTSTMNRARFDGQPPPGGLRPDRTRAASSGGAAV